MPQGRPMMAKLILEGKEVPFLGATITSAVNQASIAYIDVVPQEEINNIAPRTHVSIQVRDFHDETTNKGFPYVEAWEGEVFGFSFGKTATSRTFTLHCIDYSSYWDNVLTYFFDPQHTMGQGEANVNDAAMKLEYAKQSQAAIIPIMKSSSSFFQSIMDDVMKDSTKDFLDVVVAIYEKISKVNPFYNMAEGRLRIIDRMLLHSSGQLNTLLDYEVAKGWLLGIIGRTSGYASLRTVVQDLMGIIFHDFVSVPFPSKVEKSGLAKALVSADNKDMTIGNFIFKPNLFTIPPPMCNVFYPDEYSSFQFQRNFFKEPTRLLYFPKLPVVLTKTELSLPMVAQPDSLGHFLFGAGDNPYTGDGALQVSGSEQGHVNDPNESPYVESSEKKRLGQFLSNEEKLKGVWTAMETMMPASTQFSSGLDETFQTEFLKSVAQYLFYKKRFENRSLQITSHLKLSVVPGFSALVLDDSSADQNVIAYCSSVTHRIYATEGGYTNVILSYARTYNEEDQASKSGGEPLVPPWFAKSIFGEKSSNPTSDAAPAQVAEGKVQYMFPPALSDFYASLLGTKGSQALTAYDKNEPTIRGAVTKLIKDYRAAKTKGVDSVQELIRKTTSREYTPCRDTYRFIGVPEEGIPEDIRGQFVEFSGGPFIDWDKLNEIPNDQMPQYLRQVVIKQYRDALKRARGFRG